MSLDSKRHSPCHPIRNRIHKSHCYKNHAESNRLDKALQWSNQGLPTCGHNCTRRRYRHHANCNCLGNCSLQMLQACSRTPVRPSRCHKYTLRSDTIRGPSSPGSHIIQRHRRGQSNPFDKCTFHQPIHITKMIRKSAYSFSRDLRGTAAQHSRRKQQVPGRFHARNSSGGNFRMSSRIHPTQCRRCNFHPCTCRVPNIQMGKVQRSSPLP